jgi:hypothetical protein
MRTNITQEMAGDISGCPRATVSRRWDLLRPAIGGVLAGCTPDPRQILDGGTARQAGPSRLAWDWAAIPDLFPGKAGSPGSYLSRRPVALPVGASSRAGCRRVELQSGQVSPSGAGTASRSSLRG